MRPEPRYLAPTRFLDSTHPAVLAFARTHTEGAADDRERAVRLFYAVRDGIRYDPYRLSVAEGDYLASAALDAPAAFCIPKAIVLTALARAAGIPAAVGFADVRNHLNTAKLAELMDGTDLFMWHGYSAFLLDGVWVKATPAFNVELCRRFDVYPLEFDGRSDAMLHEYDAHSRRHMEYVSDRGLFADFPADDVFDNFRRYYPRLVTAQTNAVGSRFEDETRLR